MILKKIMKKHGPWLMKILFTGGQWVEVKDFNEDRWQDSTTGIHFWMTRQEAENY